MWDDFKFIEVMYRFNIEGEVKHSRWKRILATDLESWLNDNPNKDAYYQTVQSFRNAEKEHGELHWSPLYFDMDADEGRGQTLEDSLRDTRFLIDLFLRGFEIEPRVWFSGNKGFHIAIPGVVFGARPHKHLTYHWHHLANFLSRKAGVKSTKEGGTFDGSVYSVPRMWRIENSTHQTSGHRKVELSLVEIRTLGVNEIRGIAAEPRVLDRLGYEEEAEEDSELARHYSQAIQEFEKRQLVTLEEIEHAYDFEGVPECIEYLLKNGLAELGTKNQADMALSGYCKDSGMTLEEALNFMDDWSRSIPDSLTHIRNPDARAQQTYRVVRTVFSDVKYHFSCGSIKKCGVEVDCSRCKVRTDEAEPIPLSDFSEAQNYKRRIVVEADAIGKHKNALIVPAVVRGFCKPKPDGKMCQTCAMGDYYNSETEMCERTLKFTSRNPLTIELMGSSNQTLVQRLKRVFGARERCYALRLDITRGNAMIIHLATRISNDFRLEDKVLRLQCYYLGHGLELNRGYRFYGYVWPHPRTMEATFVADKAEPLQSSLAAFKLPKDELAELKVFQCAPGQSVADKIAHIHTAFINTFLFIFGREDLLLAIDMAYHSVRWLNFQRQRIKGWLDVLIIGDTGQAKSDTAEKIMRFYDLGAKAAGESSSRTGLAYSIQIVKGEEAWVAFGLLARANGYLVVVDETHDIDPRDFRHLTEIRSKGVIDVKMVVYGTAKAEVRKIWIANARGGQGKSLGAYGYGVMAIPDVPAFGSLEDIRRFDYAVGLKAGEVDDYMINRDVRELPQIDNPYTDERCKNLILWVWTRTPEQIIISHDTEKIILEAATEMAAEYVPDIPLVESADIRHKLARLSVAFAGRTFSSPDGVKLVVKPEHVEAAVDMLSGLYKSAGLDYWGYSDERARLVLSEDDLIKLRAQFKSKYIDWRKIARWFIMTNDFTKTHLATSLALGKEADGLLGWLMDKRFIQMRGTRYTKTPSGREFFHSLLAKEKEEPAPIPEQPTLINEQEDDF